MLMNEHFECKAEVQSELLKAFQIDSRCECLNKGEQNVIQLTSIA